MAGPSRALGNGTRRVLPAWQATPVPVYAITETRLLPAKTQRFIDFLRERLGQASEAAKALEGHADQE